MSNRKNYKSLVFRETWYRQLRGMPDDMRLHIYDALFRLAFDDEQTEFAQFSGEQIAFNFLLEDFRSDRDKYAAVCEKRAAAGIAGNEKRWGKSQSVANVANANNKSQSVANVAYNDNKLLLHDKSFRNNNNKENEKEKDKSFFFHIKEKKEKILFELSLHFLSEGRPNCYDEAVSSYDYNDALGWVREVSKPNGDVQKQPIKQPVAWIKGGWKRKNEQCFATRDGLIFANILRRTGFRPENADIANNFRGFEFQGDDKIIFVFKKKHSFEKFSQAVNEDAKTNTIVFQEIRKEFPKVTRCGYKIQ